MKLFESAAMTIVTIALTVNKEKGTVRFKNIFNSAQYVTILNCRRSADRELSTDMSPIANK